MKGKGPIQTEKSKKEKVTHKREKSSGKNHLFQKTAEPGLESSIRKCDLKVYIKKRIYFHKFALHK